VAASKQKKPSVTLVGSGNLAHSLGPSLLEAGYKIGAVVTRSLPKSRRRATILANQLGSSITALQDFQPASDIIWICHTDDALTETARILARRGNWKGRIVFHSSGALTSEVLAPLQRKGAHTASLHPMMTFVPGTKLSMEKVPFAVEGDSQAIAISKRIVKDLDGYIFKIRKQSKVLYHALGSFSSPMVVATLVTAERVGKTAGLSKKQMKKVMTRILLQTIVNYVQRGPAAAFSGPIKRGDLDTVHRHLRELKRVPGASDVYRALVRSAMMDLPTGNKEKLSSLLKPYRR
jgi:predicted short-subunit dehydrogenase-like oxidoreductase (DUF2520 family)